MPNNLCFLPKIYMKLIAHAKMLSKSTFLFLLSRLFVSSSISIRIFEYFPSPSLNSNSNKRSNNNNKESYVYININIHIHIDIFFPGLFTWLELKEDVYFSLFVSSLLNFLLSLLHFASQTCCIAVCCRKLYVLYLLFAFCE